jgi:tRNA nucleotidyltransferase/poly(A) polymerase
VAGERAKGTDLARAIDAWLGRVPLRREVVEWVRAARTGVYLVGGTVRDALLGRDSDDLDFAVEGGAAALARAVADHIGGAYVLMDAERDVARVLRRTRGRRQQFDFAGLRAGDIVADLAARDFTVNAMALPVGEGWGGLLDPTGGLDDLEARTLRAASRHAFVDDPLRILRLVRLAGALGFCADEETEGLARAWAPSLADVSAERLRDEWMLILGLPRATPSLTHAGRLGVAWTLYGAAPRAADWSAALAALTRLEAWQDEWSAGEEPDPWGDLAPRLAERWQEEVSPGRGRSALVRLAVLLADHDAPAAAAMRLRLSTREVRLVSRAVAAATALGQDRSAAEPGPLQTYRFFRRYGDDGVEGALLAMARAEASGSARVSAAALALVRSWFDRHAQTVDPPRLIGGDDVMALLGASAGPRIGAMLEKVREAQVQGLVHNRDQALEYLRARR